MFKSAATKIAHNTTIPALAGNSDLRPLQDLITAEKTVLVSLQRLSVDLSKASDALRVWGQGEGDDLGDTLTASSTIMAHFSAALSTYASLQHTVRDNMKAVRTREEALDDLRRRRKRVGASAEAAEKKLNKMSPEHKNLGAQTEVLNRLREEMRAMDGEIVREEAELGDFKRKCAKNWTTLKFGGLVECCEKGVIVGDMGKYIIQSIPEDETQPGLPRAYYSAHSRVSDCVAETQHAVSQVAFSGSPSGRTYDASTTTVPGASNVQAQPPLPSNQPPSQAPVTSPYLPTPSLGSELTLNVGSYGNQPAQNGRSSSADELGVNNNPQANPTNQFSSLPARDRGPAPGPGSVRPLSFSTRLGNGTGRTDEDQSLMASIADALSQSHRGMSVEETTSLGHIHEEPAPKYEPFLPAVHSEGHGYNGHAPAPEEGTWPRRNMRRSTSPPTLPPGAAPAAVRAWDDGMGQGEDGAHSDRPASSSQRVPSQRRISSSEQDGEEEDGLAYDRDDHSQDEDARTEHIDRRVRFGAEGSLSEGENEGRASIYVPVDDSRQRSNSTSTSLQRSSSAAPSISNAASTSPSMAPPSRAESQRRIPRVPPPSMDTDPDNASIHPASPQEGPQSNVALHVEDDDAQTDETAEERARNVAAAREVSRELDALAFSSIPPVAGYAPPPGPPPGHGPQTIYSPQNHPPSYQSQPPPVQASYSPPSQAPYRSSPPSPLVPPSAPFANRAVSPHPPSITGLDRSPPSPSNDGRPPPFNPGFGPRGASPLPPSISPRLPQLDAVSTRSDSSGPRSPPYRTPPEYPRPTPPFSSPLMAKSTSSLSNGAAPGGAPRTISAAAFRRPQARTPSGSGGELSPADTSPLTFRRPSPAPAAPPKGPSRRLSVVNPDPRTSDDDEEEFDYIGAYGNEEGESGGQSGGYGSGKYVSDLEKR
ncbi:hypothetical protein HYDPIDRAFT_30602 [Hydnomerulius pinastri MD-312]|uniref:Uncharacterized protein n=1 Tax=Hydnomerulius pinastri MD-312 TaxID=994086 RepID=A0A0C9V9H7_9AGAM|nr:hypothetical protein HYDPIDRAFT_30602 [Hydnomerulius pinastri MD-312]